ncbi:Mur ligase family protein [SAR86 cluster bacterium]|nr:Mur ligase family protein [SAR86 cluster bacterium]
MTKLEEYLNPLLLKKNNFRKISFASLKKVISKLEINKPPKIISVTGTNGKGSTLEILSRVLSNNNYRVGLFSSPHLIKFNERIRINNVSISDDEILKCLKKLEVLEEYKDFNFFQLFSLVCFMIFSKKQLDVWLLEVGLGGRYDPVNCFDADISVITKVAIDHEDILGKGVENIGREKAGIIRKNNVTIFGEGKIPKSVDKIISNLKPSFYKVENSNIQLKNFHKNSVAIAEKIIDLEFKPLNSTLELNKLKNFSYFGRTHLFKKNLLLDVSHNSDSINNLQSYLIHNFCDTPMRAIFSCNKSKEIEELCEPIIDLFDEWFLPELDSNRVKDNKIVKKYLKSKGKKIKLGYDISQIIKILNKNEKNGLNVAFGSFILIGKIYEAYNLKI